MFCRFFLKIFCEVLFFCACLYHKRSVGRCRTLVSGKSYGIEPAGGALAFQQVAKDLFGWR